MSHFIEKKDYTTFDASSDYTDVGMDLTQCIFYGWQLQADGDAVGIVKVQESIDGIFWNDVLDSAGATITADVNAGTPTFIQIGNSPAKYARIVYVQNSGTGNAILSFFAKGY